MTLEDKFWEFHTQNPSIYVELVGMARDLKSRGFTNYGMKGLFEVLRWHTAIETNDPDFKLCNNHSAYYARLIMKRNPDLKGFFRIKKLNRRKDDRSN